MYALHDQANEARAENARNNMCFAPGFRYSDCSVSLSLPVLKSRKALSLSAMLETNETAVLPTRNCRWRQAPTTSLPHVETPPPRKASPFPPHGRGDNGTWFSRSLPEHQQQNEPLGKPTRSLPLGRQIRTRLRNCSYIRRLDRPGPTLQPKRQTSGPQRAAIMNGGERENETPSARGGPSPGRPMRDPSGRDGESGPGRPVKRRRVTVACTHCRLRKSRVRPITPGPAELCADDPVL